MARTGSSGAEKEGTATTPTTGSSAEMWPNARTGSLGAEQKDQPPTRELDHPRKWSHPQAKERRQEGDDTWQQREGREESRCTWTPMCRGSSEAPDRAGLGSARRNGLQPQNRIIRGNGAKGARRTARGRGHTATKGRPQRKGSSEAEHEGAATTPRTESPGDFGAKDAGTAIGRRSHTAIKKRKSQKKKHLDSNIKGVE